MNYTFKKIITVFIFSLFFIAKAWCDSHHPQDFLKSVGGTKNEGKQIVQHYCAVCHADNAMIQIGAPKIGSSSDWQERLKKGIEELLKNTDSGINAMPARGGCFECSDAQLMKAIKAMLPENSK
ncbi:MAG: c-type cytochrome [Legionellaceae bacterium]|nr:c-type cytochrome [Legionellaceae bacterium]